MKFILIQLIGALGYGSLAYSYFKKSKKQILFIQIISYIFFTIHYYLLGGITGAICNFLGLLSFIVIYLFEKYNLKNKNILASILILILIGVNVFTFQNIYSMFPLIASTVVIISFLTNNEDIIRTIGLIAAICWLIYAIVYKSYIAIIFEVITLVFVTIAFYKNTYKNKR